MSGPDNNGTTPTPAVNYSASFSISPGDIGTFTAVNGANAAGNQGKDITWSITATKEGVDYGSSFSVVVTQTGALSTCVLKNVNASGVPSGVYTLKLKCIDAGQAFQEITITAQLGIIPVSVVEHSFTYSTGSDNGPRRTLRLTTIEVSNSPDPLLLNGFYGVTGSWSQISNGVNTITLKKTNICADVWFFSSLSRAQAVQNWKNCITNDNPPYQNTSTSIDSSVYLTKDFDVTA